jgi:hypothetical protein
MSTVRNNTYNSASNDSVVICIDEVVGVVPVVEIGRCRKCSLDTLLVFDILGTYRPTESGKSWHSSDRWNGPDIEHSKVRYQLFKPGDSTTPRPIIVQYGCLQTLSVRYGTSQPMLEGSGRYRLSPLLRQLVEASRVRLRYASSMGVKPLTLPTHSGPQGSARVGPVSRGRRGVKMGPRGIHT